MQTLTCSVPNNINPLQTNGFLFTITKYPGLQYFCQELTLPGLELPAAIQVSPLVDIPHPGDKLTFNPLEVNFLIDETMSNWKAIHNWMVGLGFPRNHDQFKSYIETHTDALNRTVTNASVSEATLSILNSSNNSAAVIQFYDLFPISLSSLQFQTTTSDTQYFTGQATFGYTLYEFV